MPNLPKILLTAIVASLALTPSAEADGSEGIWINPALGISTREEAAGLLKMPLHSWYPRVRHPSDKSRLAVVFEGDRIANNCEEVLEAWFEKSEPAAVLTYVLVQECLAISHIARLQPLRTTKTDHPGFHANLETLKRLPQVIFANESTSAICNYVRLEQSGQPHLYEPRRYGGYEFAREKVLATNPWHFRKPSILAVWDLHETQVFNGISFSPAMLLDDYHVYFYFEVLGIGMLEGIEHPVLILRILNDPKGHGTIGKTSITSVLAYDPHIDFYRFLNARDLEPALRGFTDCYDPVTPD